MTIIGDKAVQIANNLHEVLMSHLNYRRYTIKNVHFNDRPHIYQKYERGEK
jgi:hypothetical protein